MNGILYYIGQMLPYIICAVPLAALFRVLCVIAMRRKNISTTALHEIGLFVFILFAVGLASQTVIPEISLENGLSVNMGFAMGEISLKPMRIFTLLENCPNSESKLNFFLINILGNVLLFVPMGFFPPLLWKKTTFPIAILIGFLSSLFIELCQIFEPRVSDIDDIWMNTLGAVLGALLYLLFKKLLPKLTLKFKVENRQIA